MWGATKSSGIDLSGKSAAQYFQVVRLRSRLRHVSNGFLSETGLLDTSPIRLRIRHNLQSILQVHSKLLALFDPVLTWEVGRQVSISTLIISTTYSCCSRPLRFVWLIVS